MALIPDIATKTVVVEHEKKSIITIGGTDPAKFVPNINCSFERVDKDEFYLNINAKSVVVTDEKETLSEITEIKINDRTDRYYIDDDGNLEYEIIFDQKPKSNIIELSLEYSKEVYFAYQGVLTQEDIERGAMRPENVENSYAVKCGKRNNLYKIGKLLHIYRSFVIDAKGKKSWCIQEIQDSIWKITIPEAVFNDDSLYPLKVGPTLGYTALDGASSEAVSNALTYAFSVGTMTEDGTLDSIHIGDVDTTIVDGCYAALYDDDTGNPGSPIFLTTEQTRGSGPQFIDVTAGDESLSNGESYWIAVHTANVSRIAVPYDSDTGNPGLKWDVGSYTYGSFHDPWDNNGTAADREYGVYVTYTASGGSTLLPNTLTVAIAGLDANISAGTTISSSKGSVSIAGLSANISAGKTISAITGTIAVAGINANISAGKTISSTTGAIDVTGIQTNISTGAAIEATSGAVTISGVQANVSAGKTIAVTTGAVAITGLPATVSNESSIECTTGAVSIQGINASISAGTTIAATTGAVSISGIQADVENITTITGTTGVVAIAGLNADITSSVLIDVTTGAVIITGLSVGIQSGEIPETPTDRIYSINAENRIYSINAENRVYSINAENRVYSIT